MFCHHCGTQVPNDVQFCPSCGQSMASPAATSALTVAWIPPEGVKAQVGSWIGQGWQLVKADIGTFFLVALVFSILNGFVPLILQGPLMAGFHLFFS